MAQTTFHADLLSAKFPHNFRELGSTIVMPQQGEGPMQTPAAMHGNEAEQQAGYCQSYYMENVVPVSRGLASVGYSKLADGPSSTPLEHVIEVRAEDNSLVQIGVLGANLYICLPDNTWKLSTVLRDPSYAPQVVVVRGVSYMWFGTFVVYTYDPVLEDIVLMNIPALSSATIRGITSGGSQLVIHDEETIYYSSVLDAADFTPSLATGAGSTKVLALRGSILCTVAIGTDFIIYTQYNAIYAATTGNLQFPFNYREIQGSIGVAKYEHVAGSSNTGLHVVYTTAGFQQLSNKGAEFLWPELSDGITRGVTTRIDNGTQTPLYEITAALSVRMTFVADRWICVSLGNDPRSSLYGECHLYDTALARWGRLKVTHSCVIQWNKELVEYSGIKNYQELQDTYPTYGDMEGLTPTPITYLDISTLTTSTAGVTKNRPALCTSLGKISTYSINGTEAVGDVSFNGGTDATMSRVILGKYKVARNRGVVFQWARCNQLTLGKIVLHGHSYNGDFVRRRDTLKESPRNRDTWYTTLSADAVSIEFQGVFTITDLTVSCTDAGSFNSYAGPVKKFDRFLLSSLYPVETSDNYGISETINTVASFFPLPTWLEVAELSTALVFADLQATFRYVPVSATEPKSVVSETALVFWDLSSTFSYVYATTVEPESVMSETALIYADLQSTFLWIDHSQSELQSVVATTILLGATLG